MTMRECVVSWGVAKGDAEDGYRSVRERAEEQESAEQRMRGTGD